MFKKHLHTTGEIIGIFVLSLITWTNSLLPHYYIYKSLDFDSQNLMTWEYANIMHLIPYKDFFYPYGIVNFYKDQDIVFNSIYCILFLIYLLTIFFIIKKLSRDKLSSYIYFLGFFIFLLNYVDFDVFIRYGGLASFALAVSYVFYNFSYKKKKIALYLFFAGLYTGIIFSLINDLGAYTFFIAIFFLFINFFPGKNSIIYFLKQIGFYIFGTCIGFLPFFIFLMQKNIEQDFFISLYKVQEIAMYAKTPFFPGFKSLDNIFTLTILFIAILYVSYEFIYKKNKITLSNYLVLSLIIVLLLLEQKNIIRSIDKQLTFIGFLLMLVLLNKVNLMNKSFHKMENLFPIFIFILCVSITSIFALKPISFYRNREKIPPSQFISKMYAFLDKQPEYQQIKKRLERASDFNGKVFSFPGDPMFYVLFDQKPPYYFTLYEATPKSNQQMLMEYIKNQHIHYIVYDTQITSIQDGVPDYIRGTYMLHYILLQYTPIDKIGKYILLKKNDRKKDMFHDSSTIFKDFIKQFMNINLSTIPAEEGLYKKKYLPNKEIHFSNIPEINDYLSNYPVSSSNRIIILQFNPNMKNTIMKLITNDGLVTNIEFETNKKTLWYIVNLQNVPIFYFPRIIKKMEINNSFLQSITLGEIKKNIFF